MIANENPAMIAGTKLLTAVDRLKDQTYFLCTLSQLQLGQAIFPLGSLTKPIVKRIAREQGFDDVSRKPEVIFDV